MKRFLLLVLALCLFISCCFAEEGTDTITSASVVDYFGTALEGDELMNAINSFTGFYAVTTVNPDGTPLTGFFIYSCVKDEDGNYYLGLGLAENQSRANILANGQVYAMYAQLPGEGATYPTTGARMTLELVTDEAKAAALNTTGYATTLFAKIIAIRPLG